MSPGVMMSSLDTFSPRGHITKTFGRSSTSSCTDWDFLDEITSETFLHGLNNAYCNPGGPEKLLDWNRLEDEFTYSTFSNGQPDEEDGGAQQRR